jgi:hypothetical protein
VTGKRLEGLPFYTSFEHSGGTREVCHEEVCQVVCHEEVEKLRPQNY